MSKDLAEMLRPTADCRELNETVAILEGRRGEESRRTCKLHVARCSYCSAQLALFSGFDSAEPRPEEQSSVNEIVSRLRRNSPAAPELWWKRMFSRPRFWIPSALGLATAAILLMTTMPPRQLTEVGPTSEPASENVLRSLQMAVVAPLGEVRERPGNLQWKPVDQAASYRVRLLEVDQTELWSATVPGPVAEIPFDVRAKITPRKKLLWEVTALDRSASAISRSGLQSFQWEQRSK